MKMTTAKTLLAAAALTIASVGAAQASTVTFNMSDVTEGSAADSVSSGGIDMSVTAAGGEGLLTLFSNGALGVGDGKLGSNPDGSGTDGGDLMSVGETLTFVFNPIVELVQSVIFESRTGTDTVQIKNLADGSTAVFDIVDLNGNGNPKLFAFDLTSLGQGFNNIGSSFEFTVLSASGSNPGVAIQSITVAAVPVPASLPMVLAGLGAFGLMRRRKAA